ncbi:MAG: hypothetical protein AB7R00_02255 [Kofleriaceae bacterium]
MTQIEAALSPLTRLALSTAHRAADLQMFGFGATHTRTIRFGPRKGEQGEVHEYSLHIQCAWRVCGPAGIVVGSNDLNYSNGSDPLNTPKDWNRDAANANRRDQRIREWLARGPFVVEGTCADVFGGFSMRLAGGFSLDVFPDDSLDGEYSEHWRLLRPGDTSSHFLVSGSGLED